jgi:hypothetical protein
MLHFELHFLELSANKRKSKQHTKYNSHWGTKSGSEPLVVHHCYGFKSLQVEQKI